MGSIDYKKTLNFWNQRAKRVNEINSLSVTLFNEDPLVVKKRHNLEINSLLNNINLSKDKYVLDLGCGIGRFTLPLAKKVKFVVGVDFSQDLLDEAIKKAKKEKIENVEFICATADNFSYKQKFNLVVISALFIYLNDREMLRTIRNVSKCLVDDGEVLIRESVGLKERTEIINKYSQDLKTDYNAIYRTAGNIVHIFKQEGFTEVISQELYRHREETATRLFVFRRQ